MNYFNERFRQIKHSELPSISSPNGNVGMKCLPQPFNNFLDPAGGFAFYPNFNYSRIFENDMRNCRNSTNYLPPPMHGTGNIKQTGPPFCYHSGIPNTLYQNCYHNGDPKAPHPNFFYPPNFYPHPQPSRVTPPAEFADGSKLNLHSEPNRPALLSNHESSGSGRSSSSAVSAAQSTSRNCSYIPHRPFQNPEAFFWNSLNPAGLSKYPEKPPSMSENHSSQKNTSDSAVMGNGSEKSQGQHSASSQSNVSNLNRGALMEDSGGRHHGKSSHHKKSNCTSMGGQFNRQALTADKVSGANGDLPRKLDVQTAEADSQSVIDKDKTGTAIQADGNSDLPVMPEEMRMQGSSTATSSPPAAMPPSSSYQGPPFSSPSSSGSKTQQKFGLIKCPLCGEQLQSNEQLDLHLRSHVDSMPPPNLMAGSIPKGKFQGEGKKKVAKKEVKVDGDLKAEEGTESKSKPLCQCVGCQKTFTRVDKLKLHVSKRHPELLSSFYKCPHCQQGFEKCLALKQHLKTNHSGLVPKAKIKPQYSCEECGELLSSRRDLVYHCMGHSGESPLRCPECGGKFTRPDKLKRHMFIHTGELPFTCSRCGQGFSRTDRLKEHTRLAHNESLLKCPSCDRVFDTWLQVKHHLKSHEYTCEECGESFTRKRKLQFHVMAHRTDKLLRCSECGIRFGHPSRLKKHIDFVHNSKVPLGRVSIADPQSSVEDVSKIKVEPGCEPPEEIESLDEMKVESWSYRLRRVEDLKKPQVAYADKTEDLDADDYLDDEDDEDDGDDGSYEYDCRRGFNRKRKKKKKRSKLGRKFAKLHHFNGMKIESKEGILSKAGFASVPPADLGVYPQLSDIKKDTDDVGDPEDKAEKLVEQLQRSGDKSTDVIINDSVGNNNNNEEDEDDEEDEDTDVEEVSTVFCSVCYLGFANSSELVQHSREHLVPNHSDTPTYNGLSYRLLGDNGPAHNSPNDYKIPHLGFQGQVLRSDSAERPDFQVSHGERPPNEQQIVSEVSDSRNEAGVSEEQQNPPQSLLPMSTRAKDL